MKGFGDQQNSKKIKKSKKISTASKEEIIALAFKFHSQGEILEAAKYYQYFVASGIFPFR